jgi:tetratricopeptide (TPR) repeat protein
MDKYSFEIVQKIIDEGKTRHPERFIKLYIKNAEPCERVKLRAAILYRKIGQYSKAFRILEMKSSLGRTEKGSEVQIKMRIEAARLMGQLGAEETSVKLLNLLYPAVASLDTDTPAFMDVWNGNYRRALDYFEKFTNLPDEEMSIHNRVRILFAGYCQSHLKNYSASESILNRVLLFCPEPHRAGICYAYLGMNLLFQKKYQEALELTEKAVESFNSAGDGNSAYYAEALEWHAASLIFSKAYPEAKALLKRAEKITLNPGSSPTPYCNTLFLQGLLQYQESKGFPEQWKKLLVYPTPQHLMLHIQEMIEQYTAIPSHLEIGINEYLEGGKKTHCDLSCEVKITQQKDGTETRQLGLTVLDRTLCYLVCAGEQGIAQYRLYDMLWPGDFALDQADRRIAQLVKRLRAEGYPVTWSSHEIKLTGPIPVRVTWSRDAKPQGWTFLENVHTFSRKDVEQFFSISKTSALTICASWMNEKLIFPVGKGGKSVYQKIV